MGAEPQKGPFKSNGFGEDDRIRLHGVYCRADPRPDGLGYNFTEIGGKGQFFSYHEFDIARLIRSHELSVEEDYFSDENADGQRERQALLHELDDDALNRFMMVTTFIEGIQQGLWKRSATHVVKFYAYWDELHKQDARGGTLKTTPEPRVRVDPRQFLRLVSIYLETGNPFSLVRVYKGRSLHPSKFKPHVKDLAQEHIHRLPSAKRPKYTNEYGSLRNAARDRFGLDLNSPDIPSLRTFQRWGQQLSDLHLDVGRHGEEVTRDEYEMTGAGQRLYKPLERIEIDEHLLDIMALLKETRLWGEIHPDTQKLVEARRFWVSVAIDAGTRCILAMRLLDSDPKGRSGLDTLRMAINPKDGVAMFAGSNSPWPMYGQPTEIATDSGAAFNNREFRAAVFSLCGRHLIPPVKKPRMRGKIERFFRTINDRYMYLFTGRTFGNPITLGSYNAAANASIKFDMLARHLVRLIVDAYHHTPHSGLNNLTPIDAWSTMTAQYEVKEVAVNQGLVFGITLPNRKIGRNSLQVLGITYFDQRLQRTKNHRKNDRANVRLNPYDLGSVWVQTTNGRGYVEIHTPFKGFKGVSVKHLEIAKRWMNSRASVDELFHLETAYDALQDTADAAELAEEKNGIASHTYTAESILKLEKSMKNHLFQPKAQPDYGNRANMEQTLDPDSSAGVEPAPPTKLSSDKFGPSTTEQLDPDRFVNRRTSTDATREQPKARAPKQQKARQPLEENSPEVPATKKAARPRLFNPEWKLEDK